MKNITVPMPAGGRSRERQRALAKRPRKTLFRRGNEGMIALLFLAPALLALLLFRIVPMLFALNESFRHNDFFAGLENYHFLFTSPAFWTALKTTLLFNVIINPAQIVLALMLAVLFNQKLAGTTLWRSLVFLPVAVPFISSSIIWGLAYRPDGVLNALLVALHIGKQPFLTSPEQALYCIMVLASWIGVGYWMMFLIAGLQEISQSYLEAAAIDGAGPWRTFFQIILPLLRRQLAFVLVADTVSNFILFAPIQVLTRGGPNGSTNLFMFDIYRLAYTIADPGLAYAEVTMLVVVMLIIVSLQFKLLRSGE